MTKVIIDDVYQLSDKALGEIKAWLDPWFKPGRGQGGAGDGGYLFNSGVYAADNVGDWSLIEYTGTIGAPFTEPTALREDSILFPDVDLDPETFSLGMTSPNGILMTIDPAASTDASNQHAPLTVENWIGTTGGTNSVVTGLRVEFGNLTADAELDAHGITVYGEYDGTGLSAGGNASLRGVNSNIIGRDNLDANTEVIAVWGTAKSLSGGVVKGGAFGADGRDSAFTCRAVEVGAVGATFETTGVYTTAGSATGLTFGVWSLALPNASTDGVSVFADCQLDGSYGAGAADAIGVRAMAGIGDSTQSGDSIGVDSYAITAVSAAGREIALRAKVQGNVAGQNSLAILCLDGNNNPIFEVRENGEIHGITGGSITWDL